MDANGCRDTLIVDVTEPEILEQNLDSMNITCFGSSNGSVWTKASGGTTPYSYSWNDPLTSNSDSLSNMEAGVYTVVTTDFNGCEVIDSA